MSSPPSNYFTSPAKMAVLRSLWASERPLGLRELVDRGNLGIRSVQHVLQFFLDEKIVLSEKNPMRKDQKIYQLNKSHLAFALVDNFMQHLQLLFIKNVSSRLHQRAAQSLAFNQSFSRLMQNARKPHG